MKNSFLIILFLTFLGTKTFAQFHLGPKTAFTAYKSRFNFPEDERIYDQKYKVGYQVGAVIDIPLIEIFHFYSEFYFSKKGKKTFISDAGLTNNATYYFLEAPILFRMTFTGGDVEAGRYNWHIDVGPTISYWLKGKGTLQADGPESEYKIVFGEPDQFTTDVMYISGANRWLWSFSLGVGLEYPVVKNQFVYVDFRTSLGSTNLGNNDSSVSLPVLGFSDNLAIRNLEFIFSVAYTFEIDWASYTRKGKSTVKNRKKR